MMEEGILSLRWNNHSLTVLNTLSTLHQKELYTDATIACDGHFFPVHKFVLSICSEYFKEMLEHTSCKHPIIVLKDIKSSDLETLLNYMYGGEANVAQTDLSRLIKAAECLKIKGLAIPDEPPPHPRDKRKNNEFTSNENTFVKKRRNTEYEQSRGAAPLIESQTINAQKAENLAPNVSNKLQIPSPLPPKESNKQTPNDSDIAEITLDESPVKVELTEPKQEQVEDMNVSETSICYDPKAEVPDSNNSQYFDPNGLLQDIMSSNIPATSDGHSSDAMSNWDDNLSGGMPAYPMVSFPDENHQSSDSGGGSRNSDTQVGRQGGSFSCPYCNRVFMYRSDIIRHVRVHTGEKPYVCPHCNYRGSQKAHLVEHIKRKHGPILASAVDQKHDSPLITSPADHFLCQTRTESSQGHASVYFIKRDVENINETKKSFQEVDKKNTCRS